MCNCEPRDWRNDIQEDEQTRMEQDQIEEDKNERAIGVAMENVV